MWIFKWINNSRQLETKAKVQNQEDLKVMLKKLRLWNQECLHSFILTAAFCVWWQHFRFKSYFMVLQQNRQGHGVQNTPWLNSHIEIEQGKERNHWETTREVSLNIRNTAKSIKQVIVFHNTCWNRWSISRRPPELWHSSQARVLKIFTKREREREKKV